MEQYVIMGETLPPFWAHKATEAADNAFHAVGTSVTFTDIRLNAAAGIVSRIDGDTLIVRGLFVIPLAHAKRWRDGTWTSKGKDWNAWVDSALAGVEAAKDSAIRTFIRGE